MPIGEKGLGAGGGSIAADNNRAKMFNSTQLIAGGGAWTDLEFSSDVYDFNELTDLPNNQFVIKESGVYVLTGSSVYDSPSANVVLEMRFLVNAIPSQKRTDSAVGSAVQNGISETGQFELAAGDFIKIQVAHDGATTNFVDNTFSIAKLGGNIASSETVATPDNTTTNFIPIKQGGNFENSSLFYKPVEDEYEITKTLKVPSGTLKVGEQLALKDAGANLIATRLLDDQKKIYLTIGVDDTGTAQQAFVTDFNTTDVELIVQPDFSGEITSNTFTIAGVSDATQFIYKGYYKTGSTGATADILVKTYTNSITDDNLLGQQTVSFADFPASSDVEIVYDPPIGGFEGEVFIVTFESVNIFSLLSDVTNTDPYYAVDRQSGVGYEIIDSKDYATESVSTALISGGEISQNTSTSIDITAGTGRIVAIDRATGTATVTPISWDSQIGVTLTDIATRSGTRIAIDLNGDVIQLPVVATTQTNRDYVNLGVVAHAAGIVGRIVNSGFASQEVYDQVIDNLQTLGVTRKSGLNLSPNTLLTLSKSAGEIEAPGAGISSGNRGANMVDVSAESPATFTTVLGLTNTPVAALQTSIDPTSYDTGTGSPTTITAPLSRATIQYVYQSILQPGGLYIMYGQTLYDTVDDAVLNAPSDVVDVPELLIGSSNLIGRIAVRADATDLTDPAQAEFLTGVKFGTGLEGGGFGGGGGGGGDVLGPASSVTEGIATYADTTGKVIKSAADIRAEAGVIQRVTPNADLDLSPNGTGAIRVGDSKFISGDTLNYPSLDGGAGDVMITDGEGNLSLSSPNYQIITANTTLEYDDKFAYVDSSGGDITVTLGDNPRSGERKTIWIGDKTNLITLESANPSFPINPPPQIGEGNIQGQWTLTADFLDRYAPTSRDLTQQGTGGAFVPAIVNGNSVDVYDFEGTSYLESTAPIYKGILGSTTRSFTCWYVANAGQPTGNETIVSWGDASAGGGRFWVIEFVASVQELQVDIKNARRGYTYATLNAANLFDGNPHHIAVIMSGTFCSYIELYVDGVVMAKGPIDNSPSMNTISNYNFKLGAYLTGGNILNGQLYDARLFNRALSLSELNEIINENILGGVNLSAADDDMVFDVTYNGSAWVLGVGTEALALTNEAGVSALDQRVTNLEAGIDTKVSFIMQRLSSYSIGVGFDQTINYNTVYEYLIDGQASTPVISGGVWTVDVEGFYQISVEGWLDRVDIGYDTDYVILTVSRNNQNYTTTNPAATENLLISEARHFGSLNLSSPIYLNAGDTVQLKTRNIGSTTSWDLVNFLWKATLNH